MNVHRPTTDSGRSRFWLALSLSTLTAAAVAVPLGLKAVSMEGGRQSVPLGQIDQATVNDGEQPSTSIPIQANTPTAGKAVIDRAPVTASEPAPTPAPATPTSAQVASSETTSSTAEASTTVVEEETPSTPTSDIATDEESDGNETTPDPSTP